MVQVATRPTVAGFCATAQAVEEGRTHSTMAPEGWHAKCRGAWTRPVNDERTGEPLVYRCPCHCHSGDEAPAPRPVIQKVEEVISKGGRDTALLDSMTSTLATKGELRFPAPEDKKALISLRERCYSAGRRAGIKVKVRVRDGELVATSERMSG